MSHKHTANNVTQVLESCSDQQSAYNVVDKHSITDMRDITRKKGANPDLSVFYLHKLMFFVFKFEFSVLDEQIKIKKISENK